MVLELAFVAGRQASLLVIENTILEGSQSHILGAGMNISISLPILHNFLSSSFGQIGRHGVSVKLLKYDSYEYTRNFSLSTGRVGGWKDDEASCRQLPGLHSRQKLHESALLITLLPDYLYFCFLTT